MPKTIKHNDAGKLVVAAKLLMGVLTVDKQIKDPSSYIKANQAFDADFVATVCAWQSGHGLTSDGIIGPKTWAALGAAQPTCSTSKNKTSRHTLALQILIDSKITADGVYGKRTKSAVAVFQDSKKLKADGVCGAKTWAALLGKAESQAAASTSSTPSTATPSTTTAAGKKYTSTVNYKQHDKRWGSKMYSNHGDKKQTMANSGCGPTATANVIAMLVDKKVTPWDLAQLAMKWGDRTKNSGTATSFFKHIQKYYKFKKVVGTGSLDAVKACLDAGGYVVCRMGPGYWTNGGHYITAWAYDDKYIYCNDPSSPTSKRAERKKQKLTDFVKQRKDFWCIYPEREGQETAVPFDGAGDGNTTGDTSGTGSTSTPSTQMRGSAIIDISKWQPTINYDKLIQASSLIILRAGYRGTGGGIKKDQKFELHAGELKKRGIPFGVYFYTLAKDETMARDEARMFHEWAKDYAPLFWALDAEKKVVTHDAIAAFADELRKLGAARIGCYVAHQLYSKYQYGTLRGLFDFTWIPRYGKNDGTVEGSAKPKHECDLWQYTSKGKIAGIGANKLDLNVITGTGKTLSWFLGGDE